MSGLGLELLDRQTARLLFWSCILAPPWGSFEDTRAMLEPAGAISIAGVKKYLASRPLNADGSKGNYIAVSSDASNIEFGAPACEQGQASAGTALHAPRLRSPSHPLYPRPPPFAQTSCAS